MNEIPKKLAASIEALERRVKAQEAVRKSAAQIKAMHEAARKPYTPPRL